MIVEIIFLLVGIIFCCIYVYLWVLAVAGLLPEKRQVKTNGPLTKFGIVIPAHNESQLLPNTLARLSEVDYPKELYEVIVVADNCDDDTAAIARKAKVTCWERHDEEHTGKGFVLQWAFNKLPTYGDHGAYLVIDADTLLEPDFLQVLNLRLVNNAKAVQGYSDVINPERSPMESLSYLGFVLNRNLRYRGRTKLGWTSNLMGTGMCFSREVIEEHGWIATSIVEDVEYGMFLHLHDVRVEFAPEARLWVQLHDTFKDTKGQRRRWDLGKFAVRNKYLPKLFRKGLRTGDLSYFDSSLELLIPPFTLFFVLTFFCYGVYLASSQTDILFLRYLWHGTVSLASLYVLTGLLYARAGFKVYLSLLYVPFFLIWRFWIVIQGSLAKKHDKW